MVDMIYGMSLTPPKPQFPFFFLNEAFKKLLMKLYSARA